MTHPIYTEQTLSILSLPHLKSIYNQIGCTLDVGDKRRKIGYMNSILNFQKLGVEFVELIAIAEIEPTPVNTVEQVEVVAQALTFASEINGAQLFVCGDKGKNYFVYLDGNWVGNIRPTAKPYFTFTKESWCVEGGCWSVAATLPEAVELLKEYAHQVKPSTADFYKMNWRIDEGIVEPVTHNKVESEVQIELLSSDEVKPEVQIGNYTVTFVQTLPSGQHAYRFEIDGKFQSFLFQVPDNYDNLFGTYHWEVGYQQFPTLSETLAFASNRRFIAPSTEIELVNVPSNHQAIATSTDDLSSSTDDLDSKFKFELGEGE